MPHADFRFAEGAVLEAITPQTRVVFLTNPNNPTGAPVPFEAIRNVARRVPKESVVFVDEAYAEFAGRSFIPELAQYPNVIVGRTFEADSAIAQLQKRRTTLAKASKKRG